LVQVGDKSTLIPNDQTMQLAVHDIGGNYERLVELKTKYDSTNFLQHIQNVTPQR
jgi:hypothetical protein